MGENRLLDVRNLVVEFGKPGARIPVVRDVSFSIARRTTTALVGESGSGKTVTSLSIIGLVGKNHRTQSVSGSIEFVARDGRTYEITELDREDMRKLQGAEIAMIFQEPMTSLNPVLRIGEQIAEVIVRHRNKTISEAWEMAEDLLRRVEISDAAGRLRSYPHQLSGGMRQRVMIAMALSCNPSLLIADEPTTALDVTIQAQILDLIANLKSEFGASVLFITHDLGVVREIADRTIVLYAGSAVEEGPTGEVIANPIHPYTRGLIECMPMIREPGEDPQELQPISGNVANPAAPPPGCAFHPRCPFSVEGLCTTDLPALERAAADRQVRCARWRELPGEAT